ncbi:C4-dicarboxylate ABC transporter permease [Primorskyibacter flagellatus]|uniref:TRAP transporter small permease protein n=1 Tax=Primorskyibacter flagellatus TaxID=1387277 RepID=A0A917A5E0_9RHOB|nr:TRAP transporter small permease [Primorskyibacter flagellatus]GGE28284.1 C4-dicarboxylate ABC transporter permease [Primorskyibacter flagellatus]
MTDTLIENVSRWLAWAAGAVILFGCALPITVDVLSRYFLNRSAVESFEISGFGLAACIGLGMAHTVTTKAHIRVDFAVARLPFPLRAACDLLAACVLAVVAGALAWFAWKTAAQSYAMGAQSMSLLRIPMVIPQGIWWVGLFWFAFVAVLAPLRAVLRLVRGDREGFNELVGSADINAEIDEAVHAAEGRT